MQTTSSLYDNLIAESGSWFETKLDIRDRITNAFIGKYTEQDLYSISTNIQTLQNTFEVGNAVAGEIDIVMVKPSVEIPPMAKLMPYVRVRNETQASEWLMQGVYYVDTREESKSQSGEKVLILHGYDAMLFAEQEYVKSSLSWPAGLRDILDEICNSLDYTLDNRTLGGISNATNIEQTPVGFTYREMLGYIAGLSGGNFVFNEQGRLRFIAHRAIPAETNLLINSAYDVITFGGDAILV